MARVGLLFYSVVVVRVDVVDIRPTGVCVSYSVTVLTLSFPSSHFPPPFPSLKSLWHSKKHQVRTDYYLLLGRVTRSG